MSFCFHQCSVEQHSNAGSVTVPLYNGDALSPDTLETITETSGRSRARSFSRGIKELFRGSRQKSAGSPSPAAAASAADNNNDSIAVISTISGTSVVISNPSGFDGKPSSGSGTFAPWPYWAKKMQVGSSGYL